jgi:UDP-N-acetylmuramoylalanine--D-glutamate ligase
MPKTPKRTLVVGLGTSGVSACRFLRRRDVEVVAVDFAEDDRLRSNKAELESLGVEVRLGTRELPQDVGQIVLSPGVPLAEVSDLMSKKIPVIGEFELGAREIEAPIVAVTGTNGKSTVVTNIAKGLELAGLKSRAIGNLGTPVTEWVDQGEKVDWAVLEASSYQLETIDTFCPRVAVVLNVAPDHLTRHGTMEEYLAAKSRIAENQTIDDALVLHRDLSGYQELQKTRGRLFWYGKNTPHSKDGLSLEGDGLIWRGGGPSWTLRVSLEGVYPHEVDNLLAVIAALVLCGVDPDSAVQILGNPTRLPHRLEPAGTVKGVLYINDSKATNVHAALAALRAVGGDKLVWLVGGQSKNEDLTPLAELARDLHVSLALCFGEDGPLFREALADAIPTESAKSLREAFLLAAKRAEAGATVLLSPAGASFDEFQNFEDRGNRFKEWVAGLKERAA